MSKNDYIKEYLDYYIDSTKSLPFAVLLKGKWGCGKTFFIKDYINTTKSKKVLHISLYGVSGFDEIKEKIVIGLIPFIPKKYNSIVDSLLKNIKRVPKLQEWIPSDTDGLLIDFCLTKKMEYVFVFDDIERCNIEIDKLLGYINNFVEFKNQKVILVANEEELLKSESGEKYRTIKEKLIGKEFHINPLPEEAVSIFADKLIDQVLVKRLENIKEILLKVFIQSECNNLRLIEQALSSFEYFFKTLPPNLKDNSELFEKMFYEFVVMFLEYKKGTIKSEDFSKEYAPFFKGFSDKDNGKKDHFLDKYDDGLSYWLTCFNVKILGKILQGMNLSETEKQELIKNFESILGVNKESWRKLWECYDRTDEDFFENLKDVQERWNNKSYLDFRVFLHVFGMFLGFSKTNLLKKEMKVILREGKEYIEFLIKENKFPLDLKEQDFGFGWKSSAYGLGYSGMDTKEWETLMEFIEEKTQLLRETCIKEKITNELMPVLRGEKHLSQQSLDLFINHNFLHNNGKKEAYFQYLDVDEIAEILSKDKRVLLSVLQKTFKDRYGSLKADILNIEQEIPFLQNLKNKLECKIKDIEKKFGGNNTPKSSMLQTFINEAIEPFIKE